MSRWNKYNLFGAISGVSVLIICLIYIKVSPILLLPGSFALGISYRSIKNMIKGVPTKEVKKSTTYNYTRSSNKKKKRKKAR